MEDVAIESKGNLQLKGWFYPKGWLYTRQQRWVKGWKVPLLVSDPKGILILKDPSNNLKNLRNLKCIYNMKGKKSEKNSQ